MTEHWTEELLAELKALIADEVERQLAQLPRKILSEMIAEEVRKQLKELAQIRVEMGAHPLPSAKKDT
jgi:hypothetical protein